jgi:hypothetical protein
MAITTQGVVLTVTPSTGDAVVVKIKDFPDLSGEPEMVEMTTLADSMQKYELGVQAQDSLEFTVNFDGDTYASLKLLESEHDNQYTLSMGVATEGAFLWEGSHSVYLAGGGVNAPLEMKLVCVPETEVELES